MWYSIDGFLGRLRMSGATRQDFVQRMSTGDVARLRPGQGMTTVFTTPIGRMVDYARVLCFEDSLLLLTGGGNVEKLSRWLRKYVFFQDDVRLADETSQQQLFAVFGDDVPEEVRGLPLHHHVKIGDELWVRNALGDRPGAWVLSTEPCPGALDAAAFESLRVEAGLPRFPNELNEDYIPLEAGVWDAVSFRKGCYVGQEIIARMESRGQLARRLVRMHVEQGVPVAGGELLSEGQACGRVTSVAGHSALGYVRSSAFGVDRLLHSGDATMRVLDAVTISHS